MGTPVFKDISLMVFPLFLKSIIVFNFFVLRLIPGGRPILLPFCLANSIPSLSNLQEPSHLSEPVPL